MKPGNQLAQGEPALQTDPQDPQDRQPVAFHIVVHPDKCIGAGHCVKCAPDVFSQDEDDGVVIVLQARPPLGRLEAVESAARMCPTAVIEVHKEFDTPQPAQ